ncbi:hypothetical protein BUALT_Bualt07G0050800 [Buddleja alternifolia]|uniref:B box-type domain-containing protein n=1 Tax=Buddleja alternifolia TaxID=168488 RepID=A0AAV6X9H9_9LAMI|nr:hypothetical protein BUALT_Bualt07G0050800 [Buddleja alternifolia]
MNFSTPVMQQDDNAIQRNDMTHWLEKFFNMTFFSKCSVHQYLQKNELKRYCITCDVSACIHCISSKLHDGHDILTIYRHVYQEAVPLSQLENHIDCSKIQTYKCNQNWVISLKPLPHTGSGALIQGDGACRVCKRKLTKPNDEFWFCSIACKFQPISRRRNRAQIGSQATSSQTRAVATQDHVSTSQMGVAAVEAQASTSQVERKRSRKGVPRRANS